MIRFDEPTNPEWNNWRRRCEIAQERLNRDTEEWRREYARATVPGERAEIRKRKPKADSVLYSDRKPSVYCHRHGPFHDKCAYCETRISPGDFGDIGHYRPKSGVRDPDT